MITLYTTKPDEHCHEVSKGIYGRPVHTFDQTRLRKLGWVSNPSNLKVTADVRNEKEASKERQEEAEVSGIELWSAAYVKKFGRKPHHMMKVATIRRKVEESDD